MSKNLSSSSDEKLRPFPLEQLEKRTDRYLDQIRQEAERIANETREEIIRFREESETALKTRESEINQREEALQAREEELNRREEDFRRRETSFDQNVSDENWGKGYQDGLEAGREDGFEEGKQRAKEHFESDWTEIKEGRLQEFVESELPPLKEMTGQLREIRQSLLDYWEKNILQIAAAIAHQTIMRELPNFKELPLDLLREALELAIGSSAVKIRMNPADAQNLRPSIESLLTEFSDLASTELIEDPRVSQGGCILENSLGTIDQRLESRLERIISELSQT